MTRGTIKLARPITGFDLDLDENSIEAAGYLKVVHCSECKRSDYITQGILVCDMWHNIVEETDWCSRAEKKE